MGKIIQPNKITEQGPWLLNNESLEDLAEVIQRIEDCIKEGYDNKIKLEIQKRLDELDDDADVSQIKSLTRQVKESYKFSGNEKSVIITSKQEKTIQDLSLSELLKDHQINDINPKQLIIIIAKGKYSFALDINMTYNEIEFEIKTLDDETYSNIRYEITKWLDRNKPNIIIRKWSEWFPTVSIIGVFFYYLLVLLQKYH